MSQVLDEEHLHCVCIKKECPCLCLLGKKDSGVPSAATCVAYVSTLEIDGVEPASLTLKEFVKEEARCPGAKGILSGIPEHVIRKINIREIPRG
ncbi:MAG: hypothetical protein ACYTEQ_01595 [Planctomycetota bacterium]|jgi:hypothetical protein